MSIFIWAFSLEILKSLLEIEQSGIRLWRKALRCLQVLAEIEQSGIRRRLWIKAFQCLQVFAGDGAKWDEKIVKEEGPPQVLAATKWDEKVMKVLCETEISIAWQLYMWWKCQFASQVFQLDLWYQLQYVSILSSWLLCFYYHIV